MGDVINELLLLDSPITRLGKGEVTEYADPQQLFFL